MSPGSRRQFLSITALALGLLLFAVVAVQGGSGDWRPMSEEALASRFVGAVTANDKCCKRAELLPCNPCRTNPDCDANHGISSGACVNSQGESSAECVTKADLYCASTLFNEVTVTVEGCSLTGETEACMNPPNTVRCIILFQITTNKTYKNCPAATVDICPPEMQPTPSCPPPQPPGG